MTHCSKTLNIKFHKHSSTSSYVVPCVLMDIWTGVTVLIATFHNFASAADKTFAALV